MSSSGALISVSFSALCAAGGTAARPRTPRADNMPRTILIAVAAAAPVLCWIIVLGHPLAASLSFLASTAAAGQLRDQRHKTPATQITSGDIEEPTPVTAEDSEPAPIPQPW